MAFLACFVVIVTWHQFFLVFYEKIYQYLKEGEVWRKVFSNQIFCHACYTRFAVFFSFPSCCVSSIMTVSKYWCCIFRVWSWTFSYGSTWIRWNPPGNRHWCRCYYACYFSCCDPCVFFEVCRMDLKECFHMTSRRPYWCPKTMKRRPCWCSKPILWELNSFLM